MVRQISQNDSRGVETGAGSPDEEPARVSRETEHGHGYHYWRGASGLRYLHTVYPLLDCPAVPRATYILARSAPDGSRLPLAVGQTVAEAESLNLAHLRQRAARLGANEVHLHFLAEQPEDRAAVEEDLAMRQLGRSSERARAFTPANDTPTAACA